MRYGERLIAEGKVEGVLEGQRSTLLKQLRLKFGEPDARVQGRVAAATPADLERWLERILTADRVDAVFES